MMGLHFENGGNDNDTTACDVLGKLPLSNYFDAAIADNKAMLASLCAKRAMAMDKLEV